MGYALSTSVIVMGLFGPAFLPVADTEPENAEVAEAEHEVKVMVSVYDIATNTVTAEAVWVSDALTSTLISTEDPYEVPEAIEIRLTELLGPASVAVQPLPLYYTREWCEDTQQWKWVCCEPTDFDVAFRGSLLRVHVGIATVLE